jgi:phosphoesterase RecJ-like protein
VCAKFAGDRKAVASAIQQARRLLLTSHTRPDGDALGSVLAMHLAATAAGKASRMMILDTIPRRYAFLYRGGELPAYPDSPGPAFAQAADEADLVLVIDTAAYGQLRPVQDELKARRQKVAAIDHHATADDLAAALWQDMTAGATGVLIAELLEELLWPIEPWTAEAIMTALCSDTGWLRYPNTDARLLNCVGRMIEHGVKPDELYAKLYLSDRPQRVKLLAAALDSLELHCGGKLAFVKLTCEDFGRTGAEEDESEDFASEPLRIAGVEAAFTLICQPDGLTRAGLRSRSIVDVARIARSFGGGGHVRAAGFRSKDPIPLVRQRLLEAGEQALRELGLL